jgi:hypothetical protein
LYKCRGPLAKEEESLLVLQLYTTKEKMTLDFTTMERSIPYDDRKTKRSKGFLELFHENTISSTFYSLRPHHIWNIFLCQLRQQPHTVPNLCLINLISMIHCWIDPVSFVKYYIKLFPPTLTLISISSLVNSPSS